MDKSNMSNIAQNAACANSAGAVARDQKADAFFNDSIFNAEAAAFSHQQLTDHMAYAEGMEILYSKLLEQVTAARDAYNYEKYKDNKIYLTFSAQISKNTCKMKKYLLLYHSCKTYLINHC